MENIANITLTLETYNDLGHRSPVVDALTGTPIQYFFLEHMPVKQREQLAQAAEATRQRLERWTS